MKEQRKKISRRVFFQAVVNQTIAGLAAGRKIKGKVAFLGGPLFFHVRIEKTVC